MPTFKQTNARATNMRNKMNRRWYFAAGTCVGTHCLWGGGRRERSVQRHLLRRVIRISVGDREGVVVHLVRVDSTRAVIE